jgi:hypothetical protein
MIKGRPQRRLVAAALLAASSAVIPVFGVTSSASASQQATAADSDPLMVDPTFIKLWNSGRMDELRPLFTADAVFAFPNHELLRGPDEIVGFFKQIRPLVGNFASDEETHGGEVHKMVRTADLVSLSVSYTTTTGLRTNDTEILARQADGAWKYTIAATGLRDPLR